MAGVKCLPFILSVDEGHGIEDQLGIIIFDPTESPFVFDQQHGLIISVEHEHAAIGAAQRRRRDRFAVLRAEPTSDFKRQHRQQHVDAVLAFQSILKNFKLQSADGADDIGFGSRADLIEQLNGALLRQLLDALDELLAFESVLRLNARKLLGREHGEVFKLEFMSGVGQGVADAEHARVEEPDDISRERFIDDLTVLSEELLRLSELDQLVGRRVPNLHIALEFARADSDECQPIPMRGIHIRLDFEDEGGELLIGRLDDAVGANARSGRRSESEIFFQEIADAEVGHGGTEEYRSEIARVDLRSIERVAGFVEQHEIVLQIIESLLTDPIDHNGVVGVENLTDAFGLTVGGIFGEELNSILLTVEDAEIIAVDADGPIHGISANAEDVLNLVDEVERDFAVTVELIDEGEDRNAALTADFEEFLGLRLNAFGGVDDHDGAVDRHQRAISVFAEILMPRRVEDIDAAAVVIELQDGAGDGNAALLLDLHPIADGVALSLASFDRAGEVYGAAVEQEFFCESGFTGVGVRDDGESSAPIDFIIELRQYNSFLYFE